MAVKKTDLDGLDQFCTNDGQKALLAAIRESRTHREAANKLGTTERNVAYKLQRLREKAAKAGYSPQHDMTKTTPEGFSVKGTSTLYDPGGVVKLQWVKTQRDQELRQEIMRQFVEELSDTVTPRKRIALGKKSTAKDLMVGYPIGDHHWGMYAYAAETGGDYDCKIAKKVLADAVDNLVDAAPAAETALLANLGDYLHMDNRSNVTPASGHMLDVDTRYSRVIRLAAFGLAHSIERLLEKHKRVRMVNVPGNHDQDSASWLSLVMQAYFRNEPRVEIDMSPAVFLFYRFGANMICMTHGHTVKLENLPSIMASLQPQMWGETTYRVGWTGHVHHSQTVIGKENHGAVAESFGVLGPCDAYSASRGHGARREMNAITFKRDGGIKCRATYNADLP
jgi:predicted phosphodiesterase